jgi:choline transport protein
MSEQAPEMQEKTVLPEGPEYQDDSAIGTVHEIINASGHRDQLDRQYGILSICGMALTVDNAWVAIGTSLNVAICKFPISLSNTNSNIF